MHWKTKKHTTEFLFVCKQHGSVCCKGKSQASWQHGTSSAATHRWGWFPPLCSADKSQILGLVSTERGWSVFCHHWYVVWRCCERQGKRCVKQHPITLDGHKVKPEKFINTYKTSVFTFSVHCKSYFMMKCHLRVIHVGGNPTGRTDSKARARKGKRIKRIAILSRYLKLTKTNVETDFIYLLYLFSKESKNLLWESQL